MKKANKKPEQKKEAKKDKGVESVKNTKNSKKTESVKNTRVFKREKAVKSSKTFEKGKLENHTKISEERKSVRRKQGQTACSFMEKCGGCQYLHLTYEEQCRLKQKRVKDLLGRYGKVDSIVKMENPYYYRNKVHAVVARDKKGNPVTGVYQMGTHYVVPVEQCKIENQKADEIIRTIRGMLKSFKIKIYDEDTQYGLLRHILVRYGAKTGQIMVVLVTASPIFPSKNNFVKALRAIHPEITTIVQNINPRGTSMVLGTREQVLFGKGYIEDILCGKTFRISARSFYQVNLVQTEKLYRLAVDFAGLTGKETVLDAYCGIGTIGIIAADKAKKVIGVERNTDAVKDAIENAKCNQEKKITFYQEDAEEFITNMAAGGETADVVFMDPPRSGSTEKFIEAVGKIAPKRVIYISCNPETLERDIKYFLRNGYQMKQAVPVDMFPWVEHVECVVLMSRMEK